MIAPPMQQSNQMPMESKTAKRTFFLSSLSERHSDGLILSAAKTQQPTTNTSAIKMKNTTAAGGENMASAMAPKKRKKVQVREAA